MGSSFCHFEVTRPREKIQIVMKRLLILVVISVSLAGLVSAGWGHQDQERNQQRQGRSERNRGLYSGMRSQQCNEDNDPRHCPMSNVDDACRFGSAGETFERRVNVGYCQRWNPQNERVLRRARMECKACCNLEETTSIPKCSELYAADYVKHELLLNPSSGQLDESTSDMSSGTCGEIKFNRCADYVTGQVEACGGMNLNCIRRRLRYHPCKHCFCQMFQC